MSDTAKNRRAHQPRQAPQHGHTEVLLDERLRDRPRRPYGPPQQRRGTRHGDKGRRRRKHALQVGGGGARSELLASQTCSESGILCAWRTPDAPFAQRR